MTHLLCIAAVQRLFRRAWVRRWSLAWVLVASGPALSQTDPTAGPAPGPIAAASNTSLTGDYIAAVVNQELVTAGEVERRIEAARANAARQGLRLPADADLRRQVFDALIEERVIITVARESGVRVDETELDRAVQSVAAQNRFTMVKYNP